jgi:hypothetical protein
MNKPWDIKQEDTRQADSLPTFIIFCEDEVSEPIYFKYFETKIIKVNTIKNQKGKIDNVFKAICHCQDEGLMEPNDGLFYLQSEDTQVWCVFDRDIEDNSSKIKLGNISFDEAIKTAESNGFKVAWSNDAFELWVLLHFEDVDLENKNYKKRLTYYDRLTDIFKSLPNPNIDLVKALKHKSFSYKQDLKHENNFRYIVRNEIISKTKDAIKRAKVLEEHHKTANIHNHKKSPCTLVHHLIEELIRLGGKKI